VLLAGKWMELENNIMLSEVSQVQNNKGCIFFLICGREIQKINMYTTNMTTTHVYIEHVYDGRTVQ
jgi:hypothetical protein